MRVTEQCQQLCRSRGIDLLPTDGFVFDTRSSKVVSGPYDSMRVACNAAGQLNSYVSRGKEICEYPFIAVRSTDDV